MSKGWKWINYISWYAYDANGQFPFDKLTHCSSETNYFYSLNPIENDVFVKTETDSWVDCCPVISCEKYVPFECMQYHHQYHSLAYTLYKNLLFYEILIILITGLCFFLNLNPLKTAMKTVFKLGIMWVEEAYQVDIINFRVMFFFHFFTI